MDVIDRLSGIRASVSYDAISLFRHPFSAGDVVNDFQQATKKGSLDWPEVRDGSDVPIRNNQDVRRRLGIDIADRGDIKATIHDRRRYGTGNDLTEDTSHSDSPSRHRRQLFSD